MNKVLGLIVLACATLYVAVQCNDYYGGYQQQYYQPAPQQSYGPSRLTNYALARAYYDNKVETRGIFNSGSVVATAAAFMFLWFLLNGTGGYAG